MDINKVFIGFMVVVGLIAGAVVTAWPAAREAKVPPYFWVLIAMALFELFNFLRGRGAPGTVLAMEARLAGFVLGIVLMIVVPLIVGPLVRPA